MPLASEVQVMTDEIKDILNVVFKLADWVNTFWGAYAALNIALVGWLMSSKKPWHWKQKLLVTGGYIVIMVFNFYAQYRTNRLLGAALDELKAAVEASSHFRTEALREQVLGVRPPGVVGVATVHITVDLAVISFIWLQEHFSHSRSQSALRDDDANNEA